MATVESVVAVPEWFAGAIAELPEHREVEVDGCVIHLRCWGRAGTPGVVLVHGGSAHSGWWDHIAPLLATTRRVVALDLSGHGDSGVRSRYPSEVWVEEVLAAAAAGGIAGRPYIVGHSMGGRVTAEVGVRHPDAVAGLVIIDSPFQEPSAEAIAGALGRRSRTYPTEDEICGRFRTVPEQAVLLPYVARHVARESVRDTGTEWVWKFDPEMVPKRLENGLIPPLGSLRGVRAPVLYIRCEHGLVARDRALEIARLFEPAATVVELAEAGHHPMMDQPLPLVATLRTALALWDVR
ncbi:alpha/beta fold hydrolase [Nocardia macrotermitis]|uniref:2-succinyl-6-hydroxy-2, 4-cyclohexadiene-1-carboxylate synthase n=1 Tax=Nocardia macrotermitis TaxID=2585198 RepID=A0A7K0DCT5_9NOCA|nr:alpha/beta hydrolase [Nocardia macrotermitis]MQY23583.1 2-succinyl-6-hydroxy-2,4-cyclohexadiene-1-carboxylate synthase [Nocardia macrotermitis]